MLKRSLLFEQTSYNMLHNYERSVWRGMRAYLSKQTARTHTICYAVASPHHLFTFLTNFKISDFNKEYTNSLRMI